MLERAVSACPDNLWDDPRYHNRFWLLTYHTLFYTDLYSQESIEKVEGWSKRLPEIHFLDMTPPPDSHPITPGEPYKKEDLIEYIEYIRGKMPERIEKTNWNALSGFPWISLDKFELSLYNLRHLQHHTAQLIDRIRQEAGRGVAWVGRG